MLLGHIAVADGVDQALWCLLLQRYGATCQGPRLHGAAGLIWQLCGLRVEVHLVFLEQELQLQRYLVAQIEKTVARVMCVQAQLGAVRRDIALGAHHKGSGTAVAELELALGAREMHAATPENIRTQLELATRSVIEELVTWPENSGTCTWDNRCHSLPDAPARPVPAPRDRFRASTPSRHRSWCPHVVAPRACGTARRLLIRNRGKSNASVWDVQRSPTSIGCTT